MYPVAYGFGVVVHLTPRNHVVVLSYISAIHLEQINAKRLSEEHEENFKSVYYIT